MDVGTGLVGLGQIVFGFAQVILFQRVSGVVDTVTRTFSGKLNRFVKILSALSRFPAAGTNAREVVKTSLLAGELDRLVHLVDGRRVFFLASQSRLVVAVRKAG